MISPVEVTEYTEITPLDEAVKLHNQIVTNGTIAAQALYELCRCLKRMRDEKLYTALGYEDFDSYCEERANIRSRQAYNYIKTYENLGSGFLQSNAGMGITKLELLTHVPALDREEFMEENNVSELSVSELKARIDELERQNGAKCQQISFLQEQLEEKSDTSDDNSKYEARITELEAELEKMREEKKNAHNEAKEAKQPETFPEKAETEAVITENSVSDGSEKFRIYFEQLGDVLEKLFCALDEVEDDELRDNYGKKLYETASAITDGLATGV